MGIVEEVKNIIYKYNINNNLESDEALAKVLDEHGLILSGSKFDVVGSILFDRVPISQDLYLSKTFNLSLVTNSDTWLSEFGLYFEPNNSINSIDVFVDRTCNEIYLLERDLLGSVVSKIVYFLQSKASSNRHEIDEWNWSKYYDLSTVARPGKVTSASSSYISTSPDFTSDTLIYKFSYL